MNERLAGRWRALAGDAAAAMGQALIAAWSEPHRHYHGIGHLVWLLDEAERRARFIAEPAFVGYAIWFHDAVYQPGASDNETKSAAWARAAIVDKALGERVSHAIEMTRNHHEGEAQGDAALFLDMDFAILGAPRPQYCDYLAGVRLEYSMYPDEVFAAGRGRFLEQALQWRPLFRTELYERELGDQARSNMSWELEEMRRGRMAPADAR